MGGEQKRYDIYINQKVINMISVKLKFRPSVNPDKEGSLVFQIISERAVTRFTSRYKIYNYEWDDFNGCIILPAKSSPRYEQLSLIRFNVEWELKRVRAIIHDADVYGRHLSIDDIAGMLVPDEDETQSVFSFIHNQVLYKRKLGKIRSSETYKSTLNSFMRFRNGVDLPFSMIDSELLELYEAQMLRRGLSRNTTSFYMRILRTNYKMAVERGLTHDSRPFRHVYCGMDKTMKRSISFGDIKKIKELDLSGKPVWEYARDMFIFSFCTRGMSFVDMAYLKKKDLRNGYLTYRRKKTGQLLIIEWTRQMQEILNKYKPNKTKYLLPIIIREDGSERRQYQNQMMKINRHLKEVADMANLSVPLSLYYSRHSWATIARGKDIPLSVISEGLGHESETTTQIYLDSIKSYEVDKANRKILKGL